MDDAIRYRVNAADCLLAAKSCQPVTANFYLRLLAFARHSGRGDRQAAFHRSFIDPDDLCNAEPPVKLAGSTMPNKQRISVCSFRLEVIHAMRTAYRMACEEPQLKDAGNGTTEMVAEKILELAQAGETDPERLCTGALHSLWH
jgi:hypothetical protein